ncbi:hypothetical protein D9M68_440290 [compost metagenome]
MLRYLIVFLIISYSGLRLQAQNPVMAKPLAGEEKSQIDTLKPVNRGKEAGKIAVRRSLFMPGLGQAYNYGLIVDDIRSGRTQGKAFGRKMAIIGKIAALYAGETMLVLSYIDNNKKYHLFLEELQYRRLHNDQPNPDGSLANYHDTQSLYTGKAVYKNNREVVLLSMILVYGLNVADAYVTARLNFLDVDDNLGLKISPSVINSPATYGYHQFTPALKLTINL